MITITAKDFDLSDFDREKVQEKAEKLLHLSKDMQDESTKIRIDFELLAKDKHLFKGALTVSLPGGTLRAEATDKNFFTVADKLEAEIRPQIEKHKNKNAGGIHSH